MPSVSTTAALKDFFDHAVRDTFTDFTMADDGMVDYLAELLSRFACPEELSPPSATGTRLVTIADLQQEIQRAWESDGALFDPARELDLSRHIGDLALFMRGFFWERVRCAAATRHYTRMGTRAYRFVAEYHRATASPLASVFNALAQNFETYANLLIYVREIYVGADFAPRPPLFPRRPW